MITYEQLLAAYDQARAAAGPTPPGGAHDDAYASAEQCAARLAWETKFREALPEEVRENEIQAWVLTSRAWQGLPAFITDPVTLEHIAAVFRLHDPRHGRRN
jgi:hypothetical protein